MIRISPAFTFDDVLLVPKHSTIRSRSLVNTNVDLGKGIFLSVPLVSSNMKTVTGPDMAMNIAKLGGLGLLHRFTSTSQQVRDYEYASKVHPNNVGISIGVNDVVESRFLLNETNARIVCIDVAHGHMEACLEMTNMIAGEFPNILLIAGNVCTPEGAWDLVNAGADVVKIGVGPGSLCTTRIKTGNGVPQLTALDNVWSSFETKAGKKPTIIADGGFRTSGDIVKALCFSHAVMLGSILAGTDSSPGEVIEFEGKKYKQYSGSSTLKNHHVEGVSKFVPFKGSTESVIDELMQGVRSGMSYQGVDNLMDLKIDPEFVNVTRASLIESGT